MFKHFTILFCTLIATSALSQDCDVDIETADDQVICEEQCVNLEGEIDGDYLQFLWSDNQSYENDSDLNPCVWTDQTTEYTLQVYLVDETNLVENGDFEDGNTGFTSEYSFNPGTGLGGLGQGWYNLDVVTPFLWTDCPSPDGIMMVVNGATVPNVEVYCTEVDIDPDALYVFSADVTNINNPPPILQFSINGQLLGQPFTGGAPCDQLEFYELWESDNSETATICIVNQSTVASGNDFSLDNISFFPVCLVEQSFNVELFEGEMELIAQSDLLDCLNNETEIYSQIEPDGDYEYQWTTINGNIINDDDDEYNIYVDSAGTYTLIATSEDGCILEQSYEIESEYENPEVQTSLPDILTCNNQSVSLIAESEEAEEWYWYNDNNQLISNDQETITVTEPGFYTLFIEAENGCTNEVEFEVMQDTVPPIINLMSIGELDCSNSLVSLISEVSPSDGSYLWSTGSILDSTEVSSQGTYYLTYSSPNGCTSIDSITLTNENITAEVTLNDTLLNCTVSSINYMAELSGTYNSIEWTFGNNSISTSESIIIADGGYYYIQILDENNCEVYDSLFVTIDTIPPIYTLSTSDITCATNGVIQLNTDLGNQVVWNINGQIINDETDLSLDVVSDVSLIITAPNGCSISESFSINENIVPVDYDISANTITCIDDGQVNLNTFGNNVVATWMGPDNFSSNESNFTTTESGMYYLSFTDAAGCIYEDSILVEIDTIAPSFNLDFTQADCQLSNSNLLIQNFDIAWEIEWYHNGSQLNSISQSIDLFELGLYEAIVINPTNGCLTAQSFNYVPIDPLTLGFQVEQGLCSGDNGLFVLNNITGGTPEYTVTLSNSYTSLDVIDSLWLEPGQYTVNLSDAANCNLSESFTITNPTTLSFPGQVSLSLQDQNTVDLQNILDINANEFQSVLWTPEDLVSCSACFITEFTGNESAELMISLIDSFGCDYNLLLQIDIPITYWCDLPNVFSPNKRDGINDQFFPFSSINIDLVNELVIYDRWGNLVFQNLNFPPNDASQGWNGLHQGVKAASGVYTFAIWVTLPNGQIMMKAGDVSLIE